MAAGAADGPLTIREPRRVRPGTLVCESLASAIAASAVGSVVPLLFFVHEFLRLSLMVRMGGLEPPRLAAAKFESAVSTNSTHIRGFWWSKKTGDKRWPDIIIRNVVWSAFAGCYTGGTNRTRTCNQAIMSRLL